jgi:23S rRNA (guanosine2251-2'-O)-methyltransferase
MRYNNFQNKRSPSGKRDETMVFGLRPVIELLKSGKDMEKLMIQQGLTGETYGELRHLLKEMAVPHQIVPVEKLNRLTNKNHQGVVGYISPINYQQVEDILPFIFEKGKTPLILIMDRITDVRNFGAITRTAECAGVDCIIVPEKGSAQINSDAIKTSAGALHKIPVCRVPNLKFTVDYLKKSGIQIIACTEKAELLHDEEDYSFPTAVVMGSEEDGISAELLIQADKLVKIPLFGEIASLNVSVASGIILYEILRQRKIK